MDASTDNQQEQTQRTDDSSSMKFLKFRYIISVSFILLICLAPFAYRSYFLSQIPDREHPFDLEEHGVVHTAPEDNAHADYEKAVEKLVEYKPEGTELDRLLWEGGKWEFASEPMQKWLKDNQDSLQIWKKATGKPDFFSLQPKELNAATRLPLLTPMKQFAYLAYFQGKKLEEEGKLDEAFVWYRAVFRCGCHFGRHGTVIEQLIGMNLHNLAVTDIIRWANNKKLTADQIQQAIDAVNSDFEDFPTATSAIRNEYFMVLNTIEHSTILGLSGSTGEPVKETLHRITGVEPQLSQKVLKHYFNNLLQQVELPRYQRNMVKQNTLTFFDTSKSESRQDNAITAQQLGKAVESAVYTQILIPALDVYLTASDRTKTRQNILMVVLAAHKYQREHSKFPSNSNTLIQAGYLKQMPLDALQKQKRFINYKNGNGCVCVYSLGIDQIDDGGCTANLDNSHIGDFGYSLDPVVIPPFNPLDHGK